MEDNLVEINARLDSIESQLSCILGVGFVQPNSRDISGSAIDQFVEKLLNDPETNIHLIPDSFERRIYKNCITLVLKGIEKSLESVKIDLFNHQIGMSIFEKEQS